MKKKITVLSLFDGISCAMVALERAGFKVERYFASEIDRAAILASKHNYPDIFHIGDIKNIHGSKLKKSEYIFVDRGDGVLTSHFNGGIDLIIGGSPCQDLSVTRRDRQGLSGDKSKLFWEFARIIKEVKPKYFVLENVATMHDRERDIITKELGVEPILIDASLVSAQSRRRLFWTNIPGIKQPKDRKLCLLDVMEEFGEDITDRMKAKRKGTLSFEKTWGNVRTLEQKAKTITASGQNLSNSGATNVKMRNGRYRKLSPIECERLQGLPDRYTLTGGGFKQFAVQNAWQCFSRGRCGSYS